MFVIYNTYTREPVVNPDGSQITLVFEQQQHAIDHANSLTEEYRADYPKRNPAHFKWAVRKAGELEILEAKASGNIQTVRDPKIFLTGQIEK